ncbi:hypothetical protein L2719_17835 [Shewanella schlegeliana]|uniref:DUF3325 domain-containing protein n=1 Tax=Shewanella schlegeliana TaxID=190308 RepID=A0ABS1T0B1_9GAMM|nr:hypothetical protein [Shewanella schlegeliana]MBL4914217.1 hypothetical protein [Shewanella schlegeliana]MCL1111389.1 hypothetical protein [Shewanella schlegeliana]GIU33928.1 hypothetical protein TUM4433_29260 [Shewanella schlegeliana]
MLWFIAAFAIATVMFFITPEKVTSNSDCQSSIVDKLSKYSLVILPLLVLSWLIIAIVSAPVMHFAGTAIGFVLTSCAIALPSTHKYLAPLATLTFASLLIELALYL